MVTLLAETADGLLVFTTRDPVEPGLELALLETTPPEPGQNQVAQGTQCLWRPVPGCRTLHSPDLLGMLSEALAHEEALMGQPAVALGSARLLALLEDTSEAPPAGHRHELLIGIRLSVKAAEVQRVHEAQFKGRLTFVRLPGAAQSEASPMPQGLPVVGLEDFLKSGTPGLAEGTRRALSFFCELCKDPPTSATH